MIAEAIINLGIVALSLLVLLFYVIRFVFRYKHEYESNPLCTLTVIFCFLVVLITTFILPVDIFLVSFIKEPNGEFKQWATNETLATIDQAVFAAYYCKYHSSKYGQFTRVSYSELELTDQQHRSLSSPLWYHNFPSVCCDTIPTFLQ